MDTGPEVVRAALEHLHQDSFLAVSPVSDRLPDVAAAHDSRLRAQLLRRALLDAIELLRPTRPLPFGSREARSYEVLTLRYVEGMDGAEMATELGVSERQVYRDLRRALEELARLLLPEIAPAGPPTATDQPQEDTLEGEMARLVARPKRVDVAEALRAAIASVAPLAGRLGSAITLSLPASLPPISADDGLLRQTLIQMLSLAVQSAPAAEVRVAAAVAGAWVTVTVLLPPEHRPLQAEMVESLRLLAEAQHMQIQVGDAGEGSTPLSLTVSAAQPQLVLVIEDNEGTVELYRRYLAQSQDWQAAGVGDPRVALDMAASLKPAAIILDVMMPRQDGWSLLQLLRGAPATAGIPVIVCSYFADPELAVALGANAYLRKPISRLELLRALRDL